MAEAYDTIIVGGGSAGSVLANRLSARSGHSVLLCEAGQDTPHGKVPPEILDSYPGTAYLDPRFHWTELKVTTEVVPHNRPDAPRPRLRKYEQARVLGGGSSINGQLANRGAPSDYDEWESRGARGWAWGDVLPFFKRVERDMDFHTPEDARWHGSEGRIPVRRIFPDLWPEHAKAVAQAFRNAGFAFVPDQNGEWRDGYYPITISNLYDRRVWAKDPAWENSRWHTNSYRAVDEFEHLFFFWKPGITKVDRTRLTKAEWSEWGSRAVWHIPPVRANATQRPARHAAEIQRLGHVVLGTTRFRAALDWYLDTLGLIVSDFLYLDGQRERGPVMAFIR